MLGAAVRRHARCFWKSGAYTRGAGTIRSAPSNHKLFQISEEVRDAQATKKPVVALETTIYTHGFPYPENVALSSHLESLIRVHGGIPATIGVLNGIAKVGMQAEELIELVSSAGHQDTWKVSRRDLAFIGGHGLKGRALNGGTTVAGTMILAHLAGIRIFATGGLGGVHRGGERSMDISADLTELGRTPVAVVASGCKSFLDIPRTLEYLETQGVCVGTFADGRKGQVDFPAFFSRDSGVKSPQVINDEAEAAAMIYAQTHLNVQSGLLFANPVPTDVALPQKEMEEIISAALGEADTQGVIGAANTPYVLKRIRELSSGRSVGANRALIEANVIRGTKVAVELAKLDLQDEPILERHVPVSNLNASSKISGTNPQTPSEDGLQRQVSTGLSSTKAALKVIQPVQVLVAGSVAADTICDYEPLASFRGSPSPVLQTSNPSKISQTIGGVGHNVALAVKNAGAAVGLASVVADDLAGNTLLSQVGDSGIGVHRVRKLPVGKGARTAQYVAFNDANKDLIMAMAGMDVLASVEMESQEWWESTISTHQPQWIVVDANWSSPVLATIVSAANARRIPVAFEPVSAPKSARLFHPPSTVINPEQVVPNNTISLAAPNALELRAMYDAAHNIGLFESTQWWTLINSFGMSNAGSRDRLIAATSTGLVDRGIPQQSIQLLPYMPNIVTKLGHDGCLLTSLVPSGDPRLTDAAYAPFMLARIGPEAAGAVGGVYMRLFPPAERVRQEEIVSVNGVGDTLLGVLMAGLVKGKQLEDVIPVAQKAAVMTLKSKEAVSPDVKNIRQLLED